MLMIDRIHIILTLFLLLLSVDSTIVVADSVYKSFPATDRFVHEVPKRKSTVGTVIMQVKDKSIYIFLAREAYNPSKPQKAGTYSDLGGSARPAQPFLGEALRELNEETVGLLNPDPDTFSRRSRVVSIRRSDRDIVYFLYFPQPSDLPNVDALHAALKAPPDKRALHRERYEKTHYAWFRMDDLQKADPSGNVTAQTIDGTTMTIRLRPYFVRDFLKHPNLEAAIKGLLKCR